MMKFVFILLLTIYSAIAGEFEEGLKAEKLYEFDIAHKHFLKAAHNNHAEAQLKVAYHYQIIYDEPTDSDPDKFVYWMNKSAANGNADAQFELAYLYDADGNDYNIKYDPKKALALYQVSAKNGNAYAQDFIGDYLFNKKNITGAISWYQKASNQHNVSAQLKLIYIYGLLNFKIISTDNNKAYSLIKKALRGNYGTSDDEIVLRDLAVLFKKYSNGVLLSAKQGDKNAQYEVAKNIVFTARVWQNNEWIKTYVSQQENFWLEKATLQGHKKAKEILDQNIQFYNMTQGFVDALKK